MTSRTVVLPVETSEEGREAAEGRGIEITLPVPTTPTTTTTTTTTRRTYYRTSSGRTVPKPSEWYEYVPVEDLANLFYVIFMYFKPSYLTLGLRPRDTPPVFESSSGGE